MIPDYSIPMLSTPAVHAEKKKALKIKKSKDVNRMNSTKHERSDDTPRAVTQYTASQVTEFISTALRATHEPRSWSRPLYWIAYQESRFMARAVDGTPAMNADVIHHSEHAIGLFQVLPSTFLRHSLKGMRDIWNPVDNTEAAIRYIVGRYQSPYRIPGVFQVRRYSGY